MWAYLLAEELDRTTTVCFRKLKKCSDAAPPTQKAVWGFQKAFDHQISSSEEAHKQLYAYFYKLSANIFFYSCESL